VPSATIHLTGNTGIDGLFEMVRRIDKDDISNSSNSDGSSLPNLLALNPFALITAHRRENWGAPMERLCAAISQVAAQYPQWHFVCILHPNPVARRPFEKALSGKPNVVLMEPLGYMQNAAALRACRFIITDSGGLQEEAPALGKPILVVREESERPEAIAAGAAILVGTDEDKIAREMTRLISNEKSLAAMAQPKMIFGDGHASERIADVLEGKRPTRGEFVPWDDEPL
jgi:UDP-N-acetylglucosamine 2-epimerase